MKTIFLLAFSLIISISLFTQVTEAEEDLTKQNTDTIFGWKTGGIINISVSQLSLTNWAAGGQNSISGTGLLSLFADLNKEKFSWVNSLDIGYGTLLQGTGDEQTIRKTDDKIDLFSKYGRKIYKNTYFAGLFNFKTQMDAGYNYPNDSVEISKLLAPAYILGAIGIDYKPNDNFTAFVAPLTAKITIVNDETLADAGAFGVEAAEYNETTGELLKHGKKFRNEIGGYIRTMYKVDIMKNISLQTKLDLFSNYIENPQNIDINWETLISMKVNKYISATIGTHLIYDDDIDIEWEDKEGNTHVGPNTQFKQMLNVGLSYKF